MSRTAYVVIVTAFTLYWLSLVYGAFVAKIVATTDFYKESATLLAGLTALHLKGESAGKAEDVTVEGEEVTVTETDGGRKGG